MVPLHGFDEIRKCRVEVAIFGVQHAAALGDLQMSDGDRPDVMGNAWSLGAALVIR